MWRSIISMLRTALGIGLVVFVLACGPSLGDGAATTVGPAPTATTLVMIVVVTPVPTSASPTPAVPLAVPPAPHAPEGPLRLASDGVVAPPGFRLAGGSYVFTWEVPRPTKETGCFFSAMLTSEPAVSPFTLQSLGPWTVAPTAGHSGSRRIDGLGAGGYALRPTGDCPWTVTITPIRGT